MRLVTRDRELGVLASRTIDRALDESIFPRIICPHYAEKPHLRLNPSDRGPNLNKSTYVAANRNTRIHDLPHCHSYPDQLAPWSQASDTLIPAMSRDSPLIRRSAPLTEYTPLRLQHLGILLLLLPPDSGVVLFVWGSRSYPHTKAVG